MRNFVSTQSPEDQHEVNQNAKILQKDILSNSRFIEADAKRREASLRKKQDQEALEEQVFWKTAKRYRIITNNIMEIFVANKGKRLIREKLDKKLRGKFLEELEGKFDVKNQRDKGIVDDILQVLVENGILQYNCYSTVCHYLYLGKK